MIEQAIFFPGGGRRRSRQRDIVTAPLDDRETVKRWLRSEGQVFVDRQWGTVCTVSGKHGVAVFHSDGTDSWFAVAPGVHRDQPLTPDQVEHILLDALSSAQRPAWPDWIPL